MATFRTRARALDMLGRQQIAGIPTAISELFKNAHDAYADRVEVDFYRADSLFVLRDDGVGMSRDEFEDRWLTLGTESKVASVAKGAQMPRIDSSKPRRHVLGEKGIGRLAIAALGPQVLILTRPSANASDTNLTAAFVQWTLFQCPGINLEEIQIPIHTSPAGTMPTRKDIERMIEDVKANLSALQDQIEPDTWVKINEELFRFDLDPEALAEELREPQLNGTGRGTHFYVMPTDASLVAAIDGTRDSDTASPLKKMLLGFTNTMTPNHPAPQIHVAFRDHKTNDNSDELIDEQTFFTPDEFLNADHHMFGRFDEYGQFSGTISVYGEEYPNHVVAWEEAQGKSTECGPFKISVGYVQGASRESTLPPNDWAVISKKLDQIGGLYIYKDNIRILPYGDTDYDFLNIEKNRTKSAGYYYFSYRRMFGVIEISSSYNSQLNEKAGREGFRENRAYRQFRAILMNFFIQIAADFFREGSPGAEPFWERKVELDRVERARRRAEKLVSVRRKALGERLGKFFKDLEDRTPDKSADELLEKLKDEVAYSLTMVDHDEASRTILEAESRANAQLQSLRKEYRVSKPSGVGLTKQMRRDWDASLQESKRLEEEVFSPTSELISQTVGAMAAQAKLDISMRARLERVIGERIAETEKLAGDERRATSEALEALRNEVTQAAREITREVEQAIQSTRSNLATSNLSGLQNHDISTAQRELEHELNSVSDRGIASLTVIKDDLRSIHWTRDEDGRFVGMNLMNEAIQEDLLGMRDQAEADLELTQIGMAVNVINHEFTNSIRSIRGGLRRLKSWSDANEALRDVYTELRTNFDHIDGFLGLFTPLQRRLYRQEIDFTGSDIAKFLKDLFGRRLERHEVEFFVTPSFLEMALHGYPSSFYPVFVNLVDNAIFWVSNRPHRREIKLDFHDGAMLVSNNGPGVPARDSEAIFESGFTRKPGGRGLGLHIAREVLRKINYQLALEQTPRGTGTTFRIEPVEQKD
jgi:signal transduction histidine kinase